MRFRPPFHEIERNFVYLFTIIGATGIHYSYTDEKKKKMTTMNWYDDGEFLFVFWCGLFWWQPNFNLNNIQIICKCRTKPKSKLIIFDQYEMWKVNRKKSTNHCFTIHRISRDSVNSFRKWAFFHGFSFQMILFHSQCWLW